MNGFSTQVNPSQAASTLRRSRPQSSVWSTVKGWLQGVRGATAFIQLLFDDSGNLDPIDELSLSLLDSPAFALAVAEMKRDPAIAALIEERYLPPAPNLDQLRQLPPDSLGYVYAHNLIENGFDPILAEIPITSDVSYVESRWQQTHDIWHVITGFDPSDIGEMGLQAFYLAQFQLPLASLLIANALIGATIRKPDALSPLLSAIAQGWTMGQAARPLIAQKWEVAWEKPVAVWRQELHIQSYSDV